MASILTAGLLLVGGVVVAQTKAATMPDAQIEANVLKALAGAPQLADQSITSTTVYGTVTLNGMVRDEPSRDLAEHLAANAAGVQKVVDQLTIGAPGAANGDLQTTGTNPNLQSDGTIAPPQGQTPPAQSVLLRSRTVLLHLRQQIAYPPQQGNIRLRRRDSILPGRSVSAAYGPPYRPYPPQYPQQPYVAQKGGDAVIVPSGFEPAGSDQSGHEQ